MSPPQPANQIIIICPHLPTQFCLHNQRNLTFSLSIVWTEGLRGESIKIFDRREMTVEGSRGRVLVTGLVLVRVGPSQSGPDSQPEQTTTPPALQLQPGSLRGSGHDGRLGCLPCLWVSPDSHQTDRQTVRQF